MDEVSRKISVLSSFTEAAAAATEAAKEEKKAGGDEHAEVRSVFAGRAAALFGLGAPGLLRV